MKVYLRYGIYLGVSAFLLYFAFQKIQWNDLKTTFWQANVFWIFVSCGLALISHLLRAYRWNMLLQQMGYKPTLLQSFWAVMVGYFMNFLFIRVGEVSRCVALQYQADVPIEKGFGTVIVERVTDLGITFLLVLVLLLVEFNYFFDIFSKFFSIKFQYLDLTFWLIVATIFSASIIVFLGVYWQYKKEKKHQKDITRISKNHHHESVNEQTSHHAEHHAKYHTEHSYYVRFLRTILYFSKKIYKGLLEGLQSIQKLKNPLLFWFISLSIWFLYYLMGYCLFFCFAHTQHLDAWFGFILLVTGTVGMSAPVQGGFGAYHWLVGSIFALRQIPFAEGLILATFMHAIQSIFLILLGGIASIAVMLHKKK